MNIDAVLQRVSHRCGMHGKDLPADEAIALADEVKRLQQFPITREHCSACAVSGHFVCSHKHGHAVTNAVLLRSLLLDARAFVAALTNVDGTGLRKDANDLLPRIDAALGLKDER